MELGSIRPSTCLCLAHLSSTITSGYLLTFPPLWRTGPILAFPPAFPPMTHDLTQLMVRPHRLVYQAQIISRPHYMRPCRVASSDMTQQCTSAGRSLMPNVPSVGRWSSGGQLRDANVRGAHNATCVRRLCLRGRHFALSVLLDQFSNTIGKLGGCASLASWAARSDLSPHPGGSTRLAQSTQRIRARPFPAATPTTYHCSRLVSATSPLIYLLTVDKVCKLFPASRHDPARIVQRDASLCALFTNRGREVTPHDMLDSDFR